MRETARKSRAVEASVEFAKMTHLGPKQGWTSTGVFYAALVLNDAQWLITYSIWVPSPQCWGLGEYLLPAPSILGFAGSRLPVLFALVSMCSLQLGDCYLQC